MVTGLQPCPEQAPTRRPWKAQLCGSIKGSANRWRRQIWKNLHLTFAIEEPKDDYTPLGSARPLKVALPNWLLSLSSPSKTGNGLIPLFITQLFIQKKTTHLKRKLAHGP